MLSMLLTLLSRLRTIWALVQALPAGTRARVVSLVHEVFLGLSATVNALATLGSPGSGKVTFSAWSWHLSLQGSRWGMLRVLVIDRAWALFGQANHCLDAYDFYRRAGLIPALVDEAAGA